MLLNHCHRRGEHIPKFWSSLEVWPQSMGQVFAASTPIYFATLLSSQAASSSTLDHTPSILDKCTREPLHIPPYHSPWFLLFFLLHFFLWHPGLSASKWALWALHPEQAGSPAAHSNLTMLYFYKISITGHHNPSGGCSTEFCCLLKYIFELQQCCQFWLSKIPKGSKGGQQLQPV